MQFCSVCLLQFGVHWQLLFSAVAMFMNTKKWNHSLSPNTGHNTDSGLGTGGIDTSGSDHSIAATLGFCGKGRQYNLFTIRSRINCMELKLREIFWMISI